MTHSLHKIYKFQRVQIRGILRVYVVFNNVLWIIFTMQLSLFSIAWTYLLQYKKTLFEWYKVFAWLKPYDHGHYVSGQFFNKLHQEKQKEKESIFSSIFTNRWTYIFDSTIFERKMLLVPSPFQKWLLHFVTR